MTRNVFLTVLPEFCLVFDAECIFRGSTINLVKTKWGFKGE
jgi:hypothetical protein